MICSLDDRNIQILISISYKFSSVIIYRNFFNQNFKCDSDLEFAVDLGDTYGGGILDCSNGFTETVKRCHLAIYRNCVMNVLVTTERSEIEKERRR